MTSGSAGYLLDASALLAVMLREPGHDAVLEVIDHAVIHSINVAEVVSKLVREGVPKEEALASIEELGLSIQDNFPLKMAADCGELIAKTRKLGLGLGDCICLTAAAHAGATAITAERLWKEIEGYTVGGNAVAVELIC